MENIINIIKNSSSKAEVIESLKLNKNSGYSYKILNKYIKENDIDISHFTFSKSSYKIEDLINAVKNSLTISEVCRNLKIKENGGNFKSINNKIKINKIDISHFTGKAWNTGDRFIHNGIKYSTIDILVENSTYSRYHLKNRLINEGLLEYKCLICDNRGEWLNNKLVLQLDHINGKNDDNRIENLRLLCPNCHSQTSTFSGNNQKIKK